VLVFFDSTHTKATLVELRSVNNSVVARQRSARYAAGDKRQNFSYSALSSTATMGARGYGVKSFSLMKAASPTPPPTSLAAGTVLLEHNSAFDMRLFVPTLAETPQTLPGLRDLTGASLIRAVLCGDGVVRCVYGQITERITTATGLQFVVGARDSQYDRRALIRLDVTLSATVVAAQVGARQGLVSETLPSALYASLSTNGTAGAAGIGILSFALTLSVSATAAPTARPTPAPTPPPTPRPLPTTRHRWRRRLHRKSHRLHRKRPPLQPRRLSRRRQLLLLCRRQHSLLLLCRRRRW
jgi:hypothetical protein